MNQSTSQPINQPEAQPPEGWLTASEAAGHLGSTARSVRRRCADGSLKAVQIGAAWYVSPDADPTLRIATGDFSPGPAPAGSGLANLSAEQRQRAYRRLAMINNYHEAVEHCPASMTIGEFNTRWCRTWNALNPTERTSKASLHRWLKKYGQKGVIGLVDNRGGARKPACFTPEAKEFILGLYLSEHHPSIPYIYTIAAGQAREHGWELPGLRTVQNWLRQKVDHKLIAAGRDPKKFRDRCTPFIKRDWTLVGAMECWVADHRQFDVLLPRVMWDKDKRREVVRWYRPWITAYLDCRTWMPVGYIIDFDSPNADRVMAAFGNGVEVHGGPSHMILDNGKDYRAHDFAGGRIRKHRKGETILNANRVTPVLEALGVQAHWAIPYNAKAKIIEPFFKIMAEQFDKLWPTYFGRSPDNRPEKISKLRAEQVDMSKLNIDIFRRAFDRWAEVYSLAPSPAAAAGGRSPARALAELMRPDFEPVKPAAETLALLLTRSKRIRVDQNGVFVTAFQRHYWADALEDRRAASGRDRRRHVSYRYRPTDPSRVWVFDNDTDKFLCVATPYAGEGVHPLASTEADTEKLSGAMALQRSLARETRAVARTLRKSAAEVLIEAYADGLAATGALDDPRTIKIPAARRITLIGDGELDRAAQAGRKQRLAKQKQTRTAASAFFASTGTDHDQPVRRPVPGPLSLLTSQPVNQSTDQPIHKESNHERSDTGGCAPSPGGDVA